MVTLNYGPPRGGTLRKLAASSISNCNTKAFDVLVVSLFMMVVHVAEVHCMCDVVRRAAGAHPSFPASSSIPTSEEALDINAAGISCPPICSDFRPLWTARKGCVHANISCPLTPNVFSCQSCLSHREHLNPFSAGLVLQFYKSQHVPNLIIPCQ